MPAKNRPSFLKRQKEQKRAARAALKRETRRMKRAGRAEGDGLVAPESGEFLEEQGQPAEGEPQA